MRAIIIAVHNVMKKHDVLVMCFRISVVCCTVYGLMWLTNVLLTLDHVYQFEIISVYDFFVNKIKA